VFLYFNKLPEDRTPVPENDGVDAYHETYFMVCISLYFTGCVFGDILNTFPGSLLVTVKRQFKSIFCLHPTYTYHYPTVKSA
jgi:hypothetical protein